MVEIQMSREQLLKKYGFGPEAMKKIKVCRVCGRACDSGELYCEDCGVVLPKETLFDLYRSQHLCCPECDTIVAKNTHFCPKCGKQLWREVIIPPSICESTPSSCSDEKSQGVFDHIFHPFTT